MTIVSPSAGATGVSSAIGMITIATSQTLFGSPTPVLHGADGTNFTGSAMTLVSVTLGTVTYTSAIPPLHSNTAYTVIVSGEQDPPCLQFYQSAAGSFTTGS